jgi:hypothetical protein
VAHFLVPPGSSSAGYDVDGKIAPGSVWRMQVYRGAQREIALWGGAGLLVRSNNTSVASFTDRAQGELRLFTLSGKALGTSMLEVGQQQNDGKVNFWARSTGHQCSAQEEHSRSKRRAVSGQGFEAGG